LVLSSFGLRPLSRDILTTELRRHLSYLNWILPPDTFLSSIAAFPLFCCPFPPSSSSLLDCALHLLWAILSVLDDEVKRLEIMERFALLLIPRDLLSDLKSSKRSVLQSVCVLPVESLASGREWIALCSDYTKIQIFSRDGEPGDSLALNEFRGDVFSTEINFVPVGPAGTNCCCQFWR
jgi:hypothetical protein